MRKPRRELTAAKFAGMLAMFAAAALAVGCFCVFFGSKHVPARQVISILVGRGGGWERDIILNMRVPRIALGFLVGGGLAVTGAVFQALLRNPLATPHTLGVSAGAALGASVAIFSGVTGVGLGVMSSSQVFALLGALVAIAIIYGLARHRERFSTFKLVLAGVTLGLICSAMIMFVRYLSNPHELVVLDRWLMGGLDVMGYDDLASLTPLYLPAIVLLFAQVNNLNQLSFGEELAAGRGVNVKAVQRVTLLGGSVLTASVVSIAGPIGFVGLIIPHVFRLALGPDHRVLLFASFFGGGAFLAVADTVARTAFAPTMLPVGVLTAMMGGPFFLVLLIRKAPM